MELNERARFNILIVDDNPKNIQVIGNILKELEYIVGFAMDGRQALTQLEKSNDYDLILLDIEMPEMNGFDFAVKVRSEGGRWSQLPMIAISSHATPRDFERGRQVGFTDYVAKFNRDGLLETLRQSLNEKQVNA